MKRILITGGSGFIGTNLINSIIDDDKSVELLNVDKERPLDSTQNKFWKCLNVLDFEPLKCTFQEFDPDVIIHLAAVTDLDGKDLVYYATNIKGTQNVIDAANKLHRLKRIIFTSSMYVCKPGFIPPDFGTYRPHTVYGESKVQTEKLVKNIINAPYTWVIIRPTSIWGAWFKKPYIDFFDVVYKRKYLDFGRACTKTYGYVENTVFQIKKLLTAENVHGKTFYLGDLPPTQISEWANEISLEMGKGPIKKIPFLGLQILAKVGDILSLAKIKFPLNSFRLSNMVTNNVLPLDDVYNITGETPFTRIEGIKKTLLWMSKVKNYKF